MLFVILFHHNMFCTICIFQFSKKKLQKTIWPYIIWATYCHNPNLFFWFRETILRFTVLQYMNLYLWRSLIFLIITSNSNRKKKTLHEKSYKKRKSPSKYRAVIFSSFCSASVLHLSVVTYHRWEFQNMF